MDSLGRYYTSHLFSELLIKNLDSANPSLILDLGAGGGSLIKAAAERWNSAEIIAADIDQSSIKRLNDTLPLIKAYHANGLKVNIEKNIGLVKSSIDVAICNPPYLHIRDKTKFYNLLEEANLHNCLNLPKLTSDIIFLAQNLKLLKIGGELGIIVPDSILTGKEFQLVRRSLLSNHNVKEIIELPERIFPKTEAKTHIIIIEKSQRTKDKVPLLIAGKDGICFDQISVSSSSLEKRMDFSYHKVKRSFSKSKSKPLGECNIILKRGNITNAESRAQKIKFLHSTSFKAGAELDFSNFKNHYHKNLVLAEKGDIIITRVGKGCVGKAAKVIAGKIPITDCLYVVKAEQYIISALWNFLNSSDGNTWIKATCHGVCAKVLNRTDIMEIPINVNYSST